jgi:hypothetical protein
MDEREFTFEDYLTALRSQRDALTSALDEEISRAVMQGLDATPLRAERAVIMAAAENKTEGTRGHLAAQWPTYPGYVLPAPLRD